MIPPHAPARMPGTAIAIPSVIGGARKAAKETDHDDDDDYDPQGPGIPLPP